jgi:hypothetical protein
VSQRVPPLPYRTRYDVMGDRASLCSDSTEVIAMLDRLNAGFLVTAAAGPPDVSYALWRDEEAGAWRITFRCAQDEASVLQGNLLDAIDYVEWHLCDRAIGLRGDLLHIHGAALAGPGRSLLLPGRSGIGKTTLALALALDGMRLLSDDVVFLRPETWVPEAFPRAFHVHDDTLSQLRAMGLLYAPENRIGDRLCISVLGPWRTSPGPPLGYIVFPRLDLARRPTLERITAAEATLELLRYSKNLGAFPRHGLDLVSTLLERVECVVLWRNDDLAGSVDLVRTLVAGARRPGEPRPPGRPAGRVAQRRGAQR